MPLNDFNELKQITRRAYASVVATGLQAGTVVANIGGANVGALAVRSAMGSASQVFVKPQQSVNGTTWHDLVSQTRTGASVLVTPIKYQLTVSGYYVFPVGGMYGNRLRIQAQGRTLVTGCLVGVDLWLSRS